MKTANLAIRCALGVLHIWCDERISLIVATHVLQMIRWNQLMLREPFPTSVIEKNAGSCSHSQRSMCVSCVQPRYSEVFLPAFDSELLSQPSLPSVIVFIALPTNEVSLKQQQPNVLPFFRCVQIQWASFWHSPVRNLYLQDYLGFATEVEIAQHISACHGPSGSNADYALKLSVALQRLGVIDTHVSAVAHHLISMGFSIWCRRDLVFFELPESFYGASFFFP
jgi:hypothetical protein